MVEAWITCHKCGHRYGVHLSQCPQCGKASNFRSGRSWSTKKKVAVGVGAAIGGFFVLLLGIGIYVVSTNPDLVQQASSTGNEIQTQPTTTNSATTAFEDAPASTPTQTEPTINKPSKVNSATELYVAGLEEEDQYQAGFSLMDKEQNVIGVDGKVHFSIMDASGGILYEDKFAVNEDEFGTWTRINTGVNYFAYVWSFPVTDVKAGIGEYGTAKITFTDNNGKAFSTEATSVDIPTFTDEQVKEFYEKRYLQTTIRVGKTVEDGNFRVTLERVGPFTHLMYDTWGDEVKEFRADFTVTNIGNEKESFFADYVILDNAGNQYDSNVFTSNMKLDEIYPGITFKGYQIFEEFSGDADSIELIVSKYNYPTDYEWTFDIDL